MDLRPGSRLGPYEILGSIGAGGMGEVYRARDPRLDRQVAVKVLPGAVSGDAERLRRFEREAKAAGALNHPNVLAVYDVGAHGGTPYVVSELLEGETLRSRIGGTALPVRKALDYAAQTARGLAAAHEKGIVHRDLKPENLFVTKDGRVKILDFGLAKLAGTEAPGAQPPPNAAASEIETDTGTVPGTVMGTVGYMSPEQVQGLAADHRSDIFSFGAVFFEMLTGRRAFKAPTAVETLTAILKQDPLQASEPGSGLAPGLERVLRHCLEKSPEERFQSARDLAFALDALSGFSEVGPSPLRRPLVGWLRTLVFTLVGLVVAVGLGIVAGRGVWETPPPGFRQLTFRAGAVASARFSPNDQTIVFGAAWDGAPLELFTTRPEGLEARSLGTQRANILSVSRQGELAILMLPKDSSIVADPYEFAPQGGTLARLSLSGGAPREVLEDTLDADWSPDGGELAVSRWVNAKCRLEYPIGKVLYESEGGIRRLRVSPSGDAVAFLEPADATAGLVNTTRVVVVDRAGASKAIYSGWTITGLAWSPSGQEVWFDSPDKGGATSLRGVTRSGRSRLIARFAGLAQLLDVGDGRALVLDDNSRNMIFARAPGESRERNLSWHNDSTVADLSRDGRIVLFNETSYGGGPNIGIYLRRTDGSPAVRLGEGFGYGLSPDGQWVLAFTSRGLRLELVLWPTRAGEPRRITQDLPAAFHGAAWLPDSQSFVFSGSSPGEGARLYRQDIEGGVPHPFTEAAVDLRAPVMSPDGRTVAAVDADGAIVLCLIGGGPIRALTGAEEGELPIQWSADGRSLYVYRPQRLPLAIFEVGVSGGRRLFKEVVLDDTTGLDERFAVAMTPDARAYAYSFYRQSHELYLVEGLK